MARREREVREKEAQHLTGDAARELYLECLQLVLRHQLRWLVHERGLPTELEVVVRDLWDLRVREFHGLRSAAVAEREADPAEGTPRLYSSQPESGSDSDAASVGTTRSAVSRASTWKTEEGEPWKLPGLMDTLAFCYLGCLLLRLPWRVGDFFRWAKHGQILYLGAARLFSSDNRRVQWASLTQWQIDVLPQVMRTRLPATYHKSLMTRSATFKGDELHWVVLPLVRSYYINFEVVFPPLNVPGLLWQYTRELALPG